MPEVREGIVDRNAGRVRRSGSFLGFLALLLPGLVVAQCTVTINAGNTTPCLGDTLALTTTSNTIHGPLVFNWTVTAGSGVLASSGNANTLFSPGSAGSVTVQVVATDTNGVTCTDTQVFNVTDASVAALTSTNVPPATQFGGLTTFSNCSQINSFNFVFQQQGTVFPGSGVTIDWGDGTADFTATGPWGTQNHTYVGAGLYLLTYTINDGGCTDTQQYNVFIGVNPGAQFGRPDNAPVCDDDSVFFLITPDATNVPGTTYTIYYGDGQSDVFQHPPPAQIGYAYGASSCNGAPYTVNCGGSSFPVAPAAGTFTACLCIENPCGGFPPTAPNIIVHQEAQASFPFPTSACVNQTVTLNSSSVGGVNGAPCGTPYLTWSTQGPGTPSVVTGTTGPFGTPQLQWQFPTPGIYDVELLAYGTAGVCEPDSITHPICIEPALVPQFNHSNPGTCVPQSISLTNTTDLTNNCSVTWLWLVTPSNLTCGSLGTTTWAVGNASSVSPTLSITQPGTYTIVLRASNSCSTVDSAPYVFTVAAPPQVTINAALTTCEGFIVNPAATYAACGTPITGYAWTFTNGTPATSTLPQPGQVTFSGSGGFAYSITTTSACGPSSDGGVINVLDSPPASTITPTDDPITVCQGQPLSLTASNDPGVTFVWTAPDGSQYTQANVNIAAATLAMQGTWSVVASQGPCPGPPATVDVIVTQAPNITVLATPAEYCIGQGTTLTASNAGNYVWTVNGSPVGTGAVLAVDTNQTLTYTVTGDLGGCGASASVLVTVNPLPIVDAGPPLILCDQPMGELLAPITPGGVWSGPNLTLPNIYTPNGQTPLNDPDSLVYTYTDGNGCVASDAVAVAVGPAPAPVTAAPDTLICLNSGGLQLTASTAGGQWSGTPWVDASGLFTPGALGSFVVNYALGAGSCLVEDDVDVDVVNGTAVDAGADFDVCANDPPVLLVPDPPGGVWSGMGLDINDAFDPALVIPDASYGLTYTYNDPNGCVIIDEVTVNVDPLPVITQTIDTTFCNQPFAQQIVFAPPGGTWSGPNVDGNGVYTPNGITPPNLPDVLTYSYTDGNGCANTGSTEVTVIDPPFVANAGNDTAVCVFDPPFALGGDPAGGDWSGPQVTPFDLFDPQSVGSFLITYAVGSASCATLDQRGITVDPLPVVDIGTDTAVCVSDAPFVLWTSASGGSWQPEPYLLADGTFDPALSTVGVAANCCYTYTDPNTECSNTFCRTVTVNGLPIVQLTDTIGCENDPLPFANTNPPAAQWLWTFGDGSSPSTDQFPSHVYTAAGTYTVQLTATSGAGCLDSAQATVVIAAIPDAVVDWTPIDTCGDGNLQVLNTAEVPGSTHAWTVNGTIVSTDAQPGGFALIGPVLNDTLYTITYAQGNYCGSTSAPFVITLHPLPVASFGTDQLIYCLADTVFIGNDSYGLPDSTQWTLGDGTTTTNESIIWYHLYTQDSASWTITQEVYNGCGADTATATVTVLPNEVTSFFNTDVVIGCAPLTPTFTNFSDGDTTSVWYFGDADNSTSVSTNTGFTYTEPGVYTVMLVSYGCGVDSAYQTINVLALPVVTTQNDTAICLGQPITFTATGAGLVGLEWDFGDGTGDSIPQPTHVYAQAGNYQVILSVVNGSTLCPSSDTISVTVIASPSAVITATDSVICAGESIDFNSTGTIGNNLIYDWTVDATSFSFQSNPPPQTYTSAGSYAIGLLVEDQLTGCADSAARTIVVNEMPESSFTLAPVDPCGDPAWILATSTSTPPNALLQWSIDGAYISSGPSFQQSWDTPGTHTLTLHAELPGCMDSSSAAFELYEIPIAAFEPGVACIGQPIPVVDGSSNVEDYWWYFNGNIVSTADNPVSLIPIDLGVDTIALAINSPEGCRDSTWTLVEVHPTPEASMDVVLEADCQTITMRGTPYPLGSYLWMVDGVPYSEELNTIYLYDQTVTASITITFVVTSVDSCVDPVSRTLDIPACVHVPNAFTADGDGNNEFFLPVIFPAERFRAFRVFDRWGELIHESLGPLKGWDGTYQGSPCMQGVYVWQVDHADTSGSLVRRTGHVSLLR